MKRLLLTFMIILAGLLTLGVAGTGTLLQASLSGAAEVGGGDPDGSGGAAVRVDHASGMICWEVSWKNIDAPFAWHIHAGAAGVNGPVVIPFTDPDTGLFVAAGCREADTELLKAIVQNPGGYYVNVHNAAFPGGALRGQLSSPGQFVKK